MGKLVFPDGYALPLHDGDIGPLEDGIGEQPKVDVVRMFLRHLLEGGRPQHPAVGRHHRQQQRELRDLRNPGLLIDHAALGVQSDSEQVGGEVVDLAFDRVPVRLRRQRVVVGDEVIAVVLALELDPVLRGSQVVAQVEPPGRAHAAQNPDPYF